MDQLPEDLVEEVRNEADEDLREWTKVKFIGRDDGMDLNREKSGALIFTNQRVIFKDSIVLGDGFHDEVSVSLSQLQEVISEQKLVKDEYKKILVLKWLNDNEKYSAVCFYPIDSENISEGKMNTPSDIRSGEKGLVEVWENKIESRITPLSGNQPPPPSSVNTRGGQPPPPSSANTRGGQPPPPDVQQNRMKSSKSTLEQQDQPSAITCPDCGEEMQEDMNFCPYCGAELDLSCENCGRELEDEWNICPNCGNEI